MSKRDEQSGVDFDNIAFAIKEHKKEAMENHYKTAPEMPWELGWKSDRLKTGRTIMVHETLPFVDMGGSTRGHKRIALVPIDEARELLADRERLKDVESKLKIAIEALESVEGFDGSDDNLIANAIKQIGKVDK